MGVLEVLFKKRKDSLHQQNQLQEPTAYDGGRHFVKVKGVPYALPRDSKEIRRLDLQHYALRFFFKRNYFVPLDPHQRYSILDSGYGTGRWAIEMAQEFPHSFISGIDIEQPTVILDKPKNCSFAQANILETLPFPPALFDYVHQRLLIVAIPTQKWPQVVAELYRITKPGGWVELVEASSHYTYPGPATQRFLHWWDKASANIQMNTEAMGMLDQVVKNAKYRFVEAQKVEIPLGEFGGHVGKMMATDISEAIKSLETTCVRHADVSPLEYQKNSEKLISEWEKYQTSLSFYIVVGQK